MPGSDTKNILKDPGRRVDGDQYISTFRFADIHPQGGVWALTTLNNPPQRLSKSILVVIGFAPGFEALGPGRALLFTAVRLVLGMGLGPKMALARAPLLACGPSQADIQALAAHEDTAQVLENFARHTFGQIDQAEILADIDTTDKAALDPRLVSDGANDFAGSHAIPPADIDAITHQPSIIASGGLAVAKVVTAPSKVPLLPAPPEVPLLTAAPEVPFLPAAPKIPRLSTLAKIPIAFTRPVIARRTDRLITDFRALSRLMGAGTIERRAPLPPLDIAPVLGMPCG